MTWPNLLSCIRMALIPVFVLAVTHSMPRTALITFCVAGITDFLDGIIARSLKQQSALGAYLDPAADKFLMTAAFVILAIPGMWPGLEIPIWVAVWVIARDVVIVVFALILWLVFGMTKFPPSKLSKWNTAFQISAIILVLLSGVWEPVEPVAWWCLMIMVALTLFSSLEYGYRIAMQFNDLTSEQKT